MPFAFIVRYPPLLSHCLSGGVEQLLFLYFGLKMLKEGIDAHGGPSEELTEVKKRNDFSVIFCHFLPFCHFRFRLFCLMSLVFILILFCFFGPVPPFDGAVPLLGSRELPFSPRGRVSVGTFRGRALVEASLTSPPVIV